jgi:transposase
MAKPMLSDQQWSKLEPLLPKYSSAGRPWKDNRAVLEGILWVLRTGARWRDLPSDFGVSPATCWRRLRLWEEHDVWLKVWRRFLAELDERGQLDWSESFIDGSFAPAKKGATESAKPSAARARSGWWWSTAKVFLWETTWTARRPRK